MPCFQTNVGPLATRKESCLAWFSCPDRSPATRSRFLALVARILPKRRLPTSVPRQAASSLASTMCCGRDKGCDQDVGAPEVNCHFTGRRQGAPLDGSGTVTQEKCIRRNGLNVCSHHDRCSTPRPTDTAPPPFYHVKLVRCISCVVRAEQVASHAHMGTTLH